MKRFIPYGIAILAGYGLGAFIDHIGHPPKPNNQYELFIYQDHFTLYDGNKFVALGSWKNYPGLEELIANDNQ